LHYLFPFTICFACAAPPHTLSVSFVPGDQKLSFHLSFFFLRDSFPEMRRSINSFFARAFLFVRAFRTGLSPGQVSDRGCVNWRFHSPLKDSRQKSLLSPTPSQIADPMFPPQESLSPDLRHSFVNRDVFTFFPSVSKISFGAAVIRLRLRVRCKRSARDLMLAFPLRRGPLWEESVPSPEPVTPFEEPKSCGHSWSVFTTAPPRRLNFFFPSLCVKTSEATGKFPPWLPLLPYPFFALDHHTFALSWPGSF